MENLGDVESEARKRLDDQDLLGRVGGVRTYGQ
jgi:hypothetical protein